MSSHTRIILLQRRRDAKLITLVLGFFAPSRLRERPTPSGLCMTELLVAATLLIGALGLIGPLAVRSARLQQETRHYQAALLEVSNQLERLTALAQKERTEALAELTLSPTARDALPNPQLSAETIDDSEGMRLALEIQWDRPGRAKPLRLVAWIKPPSNPEEAL